MSLRRDDRRRSWIAIFLVLGLVVALGASFAPRTSAQSASPNATIRFVNAIAGGGPVDVTLDGSSIAKGLAFGTATEYASVPAGDHGLQVREAGQAQSQPLVDQKETLDGGAAYNFIIGSQNNQFQAALLEVNLDAVPVGQARYQIVQAAPDLGDLSLQLGNTSGSTGAATTTATAGAGGSTGNTANNGGFLAGGGYQEVAAGTYTLHAVNANNTPVTLNEPNVTLESGRVYDFVIIGQQADQSLTVLPLVTDVFTPCGTSLNVGKPTDACARFNHFSPDAGPVDIFVDGTAVAQAISYGTASQFTALGSGDHRIQVAPAGRGAGTALLDETVAFTAGQAYQFSVVGLTNGKDDMKLGLHQDAIDLTPLPAGQARVRLIHEVVNGGDVTTTVAQGGNLFDKLSYNKATDYTLVNAGSADLTFQIARGNDQSPVTVNATGTQFKEGMVYDLFLVGNAADQSTVQLVVLTTQATVRTGAQGTPVAIGSPVPATQASPVTAASATVIGGGSPVASPVAKAPVSPIAETPTPTPAS